MDTPKQELERPNEAGFSTNMYLTSPEFGRMQFTFRGARANDWNAIMQEVVAFTVHQLANGWMTESAANKATPIPQDTVALHDENGTPIVDGQTGEPITAPLPPGVHVFTVAGLVRDQNKDKTKDILKVFTVEAPYNKGYGVACFKVPEQIGNWKAWVLTSKDNKALYAPPEGLKHVVIGDPNDTSKYANVIEFRA